MVGFEGRRGGSSAPYASLTTGRSGVRDHPCPREQAQPREPDWRPRPASGQHGVPGLQGHRPSGPTWWIASEVVLALRWAWVGQGADGQIATTGLVRCIPALGLRALEPMLSQNHPQFGDSLTRHRMPHCVGVQTSAFCISTSLGVADR